MCKKHCRELTNLNGTSSTYNAANQMTNDSTNALTYDANGNLVNDGVNSYTWNRANRLLSYGGIDYTYDGSGNRISQDNGTDVSRYLLDVQPGLAVVLRETDGTNTLNHRTGHQCLQMAKADYRIAN